MTALAYINLNFAKYKADKQAKQTQEFSNALAQLYLDGLLTDKEYNEAAALYRATYQTI